MELNENEENLVPGNKRAIQKRRTRRKALFGPRKKEAFLDALACTCNVAAAAEAAGVAVGTVYAHRRKDPEFRALWWEALEQGAAKLVALRLQREIERAEGTLAGGIEARMDGPPDERQIIDLYKLIALLKEHSRGIAGEPKQAGRAPDVASLEETCAAMAKRLKAFPPSEAAAGTSL